MRKDKDTVMEYIAENSSIPAKESLPDVREGAIPVNRVSLDTNIAISRADGEEIYPKVEGQIDDESLNILSFPAEIERVSSSFFAGFFKELRRCYSPGQLAELFHIDPDTHCRESAEKALLRYIHTA